MDELKDKLDDLLFRTINKEYTVKITWRFLFYIFYLIVTIYLVTNAIMNYYEHKMFAGVVWFLLIMSYLFSLFLVRRKEVY